MCVCVCVCVCVYIGLTGLGARGLSLCACSESELNTKPGCRGKKALTALSSYTTNSPSPRKHIQKHNFSSLSVSYSPPSSCQSFIQIPPTSRLFKSGYFLESHSLHFAHTRHILSCSDKSKLQGSIVSRALLHGLRLFQFKACHC